MSRNRAWRRHQKGRVATARRNLAKHSSMSADYILSLSNNELAKRHPYDCGRGRCLCCHGTKLLGAGSRRAAAKRTLEQEKA